MQVFERGSGLSDAKSPRMCEASTVLQGTFSKKRWSAAGQAADYIRHEVTSLFTALETARSSRAGHYEYIETYQKDAKPFRWAEPAEDIFDKIASRFDKSRN